MKDNKAQPQVEEAPPAIAVDALVARKPIVPRVLAFFVAGFAVFFSFFHLYTGFLGMMNIYANLTLTVTGLMIITFLYYPTKRKSWNTPLNKWFGADILLILLAIGCEVYIFREFTELVTYRTSMANTTDVIMSWIYIVLCVEATRRALGWPIFGIVVFFLILNLTAQWWPGVLYGPNISPKVSAEVNVLQDNGIFSVPTKVTSQYLILFMIFVALLTESGAGQKLINIALSVAGRFTGGAAKVAVIASSLLGTVEGAATANVATTGSFTIPLMKSTGYSPRMAGAIEAVSSSGAQLMPPIMGASAFVMASFLGVPYSKVILAAVIPAIIYYTCAFMTVHFTGKAAGLSGLPKEQIPPVGKSLRDGWTIIIPMAVLVYFIVKGYAISSCAVYGIIAVIVCTLIDPSTRWTPTKLLRAMEQGAKNSIVVGVCCAAAGLVIGAFYVSGLGDTLANQIVLGSHGNMLIALLICAIVSLILGMAMPTVAVYVTVLLIGIPALIKLGVPQFSAHFFCFYFGLLSAITPPVALAAFIGAGISGDKPMNTALTASRIALPLYIIAFFLPYNDAMTWFGGGTGTVIGSQLAITFVLGVLGAVTVAAGGCGYFLGKTRQWERAMLMVGGLAMIAPFTIARVGGLILLGLTVFSQKKFPVAEVAEKVPGFQRDKDK